MLNQSSQGQASQGLSVNDSANPTVDGTGQVTPWQHGAAGQLFTSEADRSAMLVTGVTRVGHSSALFHDATELSRSSLSHVGAIARYAVPASPAPEAWQLLLTCFGMAAFVLFTILRRLRQAERLPKRSA